jgi:hypothetical protein
MSFAHFSTLAPSATSVREVAQDKSIRVQRTRDGNGDQGLSRVRALDGMSRGIGWIAAALGDYARVGFGTICTHKGRLHARISSNHCDYACGSHGSP